MGDIVEALFITTLNGDQSSCNVQDLRTGSSLMKYKGGGSVQRHCLEMIGANYVITANSMKPLLHVWPINGQEQMSSIRFVVPGKVNAMALSPDGAYLIAGIQESIYIWHLNTGRMLNTLSKHYQPVTCLKFTDDGEHFASAGKDGAVLVWNLTYAVAPGQSNSNNNDNNNTSSNAPLYSFNDHGLTVTDMHIGSGGIRSYMYTVSLDRCCKVYDLSSGTELLSVVFPVPLHSVTVDGLESSVYVGTGDGQVLVFHMDTVPRMKEYHLEEGKQLAFIGHTAGAAITSLTLSINGQTLITAGDDKSVCVWHVGTRQLIKTIPQTAAITNLKVRLTNPSIFHPEHKQSQSFADNLKRMITETTPDDDDNECIELLLTEDCYVEPSSSSMCCQPASYLGNYEEVVSTTSAANWEDADESILNRIEGNSDEEQQDDNDDDDSPPPPPVACNGKVKVAKKKARKSKKKEEKQQTNIEDSSNEVNPKKKKKTKGANPAQALIANKTNGVEHAKRKPSSSKSLNEMETLRVKNEQLNLKAKQMLKACAHFVLKSEPVLKSSKHQAKKARKH